MAADAERHAFSRQGRSSPEALCTCETELDELSNSVVHLIKSGDLDRAKAVCHRLQEQYPNQVDGIWRLATVWEARGERDSAAQYYREAAEFMRSHEGFDEEGIAEMIHCAERLEAEPERRGKKALAFTGNDPLVLI